MARPVDEKIVRMSLDNEKFKKDVTDTLRSFQSINETMNSNKAIDLSRIADAVEGIKGRFSGLGVVAATVISDITRKAMNMGTTLWKNLVDPINEGGRRRAMNIEKAQFQFEGLGMDVEATMKSANDAVLGTAFGLDEAAVVAAQFGATGMEAGEEMTSALRGISGVAAMTGSSYSDIGQIFTVVAGNGRLMSNELLRLSSRGINAAATLATQFNMTEQEVRALVTKGGVSFEMFADAMSSAFGEHATRANETYTGSLSNMRAALARIGAKVHTPRLENMRDLFNSMTPVINELSSALDPLINRFNEVSHDAIRGLIKSIGKIDISKFLEMGGMTRLLQAFNNVIFGTKVVLGAVREGFKRAFPESTVSVMVRLTEVIKDITGSMILSGKSTEKLANIVHGLISIFDSAWIIASSLAQAIFGIVPPGTGGGILGLISYIATLAIKFNESLKAGNFLTRGIDKLGVAFKTIGGYIADPISLLEDLSRVLKIDLVGAFTYTKDKLTPTFSWIKNGISGIGSVISALAEKTSTLREKLAPVFTWIGDGIKFIAKWIGKLIDSIDIDDIFKGGLLGGVIYFIQSITGSFKGFTTDISGAFTSFSDIFKSISGSFKGLFEELGASLKSFQEQVKYKNLLNIAIAIGILAVSLKVLEGMSIADIAKGLTALVGTMTLLALGMSVLSKINMTGSFKMALSLIALSISVGMMSRSLAKVGELDLATIGKGLLGIAGVVGILVAAMLLMGNFGGSISSGTLQIVAVAASVAILVTAINKMADIDASSMTKSLVAIGVVFATLAVFLKTVNESKLGLGSALGLVVISGALHIIVGAVNKIADIDVLTITKGLTTIAVILAQIAIFAKVTGGGNLLAAGLGILAVAGALTLLVVPITILGNMSWEELGKGMLGLAGALIAVSLAASIGGISSLAGAVGIAAIAVAMTLLMGPILTFSLMSWGAIIKGITGLALTLTVLSGVSLLLAPAVPVMLGFGAALLVMGVAVMAVGGGIALLGVGLSTLAALTTAAVLSIVASFGLFIRGMTGLMGDIKEFLIQLGLTFLETIRRLGPEVIETISVLVTKLIRTITTKIPEFAVMGADMLLGLMRGIEEKGPELYMQATDTILALINGMADALAENGTDIVNAFVRLMGEVIIVVIEAGIAMINALFGWIPGVEKATASIGDTAESYIRDNFGAEQVAKEKGEGFAVGLEGASGRAREAGSAVGTSGREGLEGVDYYSAGEDKGLEGVDGLGSDKVLQASDAAGRSNAEIYGDGYGSVDFELFGEEGTVEIAKGARRGRAMDRVGRSGQTNAEIYGDGYGSVDFESFGEEGTVEIAKGARRGRAIDRVERAAVDVGRGGRGGFASVKTEGTGENFSKGFGNGISNKIGWVKEKAKSVGLSALSTVKRILDIQSPSRETRTQGGFFGEGLALGIADKVKDVASSAKDMAVTASEALSDALLPIMPDEDDLTIRLLLDDDDINWDTLSGDRPIPMRPDSSFVSALAAATSATNRQNDYKNRIDNDRATEEVHNHNYTIGVTAGGNMSKEEVRKLAKDIQTEIKNQDDKFKMGRGQEVVF